jgi:hypothetical protein
MEQVLDVYKQPYDPKHPKICLDETSKQLVSEIRQPIITANGTTLYDYEYHREGTCDLFMVCEPLTGQRFVTVRDQHTRFDWASVVADLVENRYPEANKITLIQDNLSAHKPSALYELFEPDRAKWILDKLEFVFTPKHGSWLNIAEIELSVLARQCLSGRIASKQRLIDKVALWQNRRNSLVVKVDWQFTTADARIKLKHLYPSIVT